MRRWEHWVLDGLILVDIDGLTEATELAFLGWDWVHNLCIVSYDRNLPLDKTLGSHGNCCRRAP